MQMSNATFKNMWSIYQEPNGSGIDQVTILSKPWGILILFDKGWTVALWVVQIGQQQLNQVIVKNKQLSQ